jgi:hypothetical protein
MDLMAAAHLDAVVEQHGLWFCHHIHLHQTPLFDVGTIHRGMSHYILWAIYQQHPT